MSDADAAAVFDQWCIVELLGHRRAAGRLREVTIAGAGFLRLDVPGGRTQIFSPGSVYALHPVDEDLALTVAKEWRSEPVTPWELQRAIASAIAGAEDGPF